MDRAHVVEQALRTSASVTPVEGESEGLEQAEDLLEERASHEDDRGGPLRDRPDPEEPGGRTGSYGEGDRVDSTETEADRP